MTESENKDIPEAEENEDEYEAETADGAESLYCKPYSAVGGQLCLSKLLKNVEVTLPLCNFLPRIISELIIDDGGELTRRYRIGVTTESGRELPPIDVAASELESMSWVANNLDASCDLFVVGSVEKHVRCAIKSTARFAEKKMIFAHTGWKKIDGAWHYLLPGNGTHEVCLHGKQQSYAAAQSCDSTDLAYLAGLLEIGLMPCEQLYPCLALVFLSPLNEFLKHVGHEPKFLLTLIGRTGCMKSTLAALMLSFFGHFSGTDLPMSFRDTANSIVHNAFALKDVLTCVDDYHPTARRNGEIMRSTMQTLARGYGDRAARNRLSPDITLREARPPQGNVIITAEFPPDIGESGTARLFCIEMKSDIIDIPLLSEMQEMAQNGRWMCCMFGYTEWLKEKLSSQGGEEKLLTALRHGYEKLRTDWRCKLKDNRIEFHDRLPDTLACLEVGFSFLLNFLHSADMLTEEQIQKHRDNFREILLGISAKQSAAVTDDKPTHIYIRKLLALVESGQVTLLPTEHDSGVLPSSFIGYEDDDFYYVALDISHKAVKRFCSAQDECFAISSRALAKALAEEGLIESDDGKNTRTMFFGSVNKRVMLLRKREARKIFEDGV